MTLVLTDLDGTLLDSSEYISDYSLDVINHFIQNGGCFSYATARSIVTASKITKGLEIITPVICNNGSYIVDSISGKLLQTNFFSTDEVEYISSVLISHNIYPVMQSFINGVEKLSYIKEYVTNAMQHYLNSRIGDPRRRVVSTSSDLYLGDIFRFGCMDSEENLLEIKDIFEADTRFYCIYTKEVYSNEKSFEILPKTVSKANAALQLKDMLGCDKMIVFGDEMNDIPLFQVADEKYATANAVDELKEIATTVIDSNDNDGVAKWILVNLL